MTSVFRTSRQVVGALIFTFLIYLQIGTLFSTLPGFVHTGLGYGPVLAGSAISLQFLATFASRAAAGRHGDRHGPKRSVVLGFGIAAAAGLLLCAAGALRDLPAAALAMLAASRLALGVAESFVGTGTLSWGVATLGPSRMAQTISWNGIMSYGGMAVGAPLGVALSGTSGIAGLGICLAAISLAGWSIARQRPAARPEAGKALDFAAVFRRVLPYGLALALAATGFGTIAAFTTLYFASRHWSGAAFALTGFGICFAALRVVLGRAINRLGGLAVALAALALQGPALVLMALAASPWQAGLAAALIGLSFAPMFPALGVVAVARVPAASRGSALGTYNLFADLAFFAAGPLGGWVAGHAGYGAVFLCAAGAVALAAALVGGLLATARE